MRVDLHTHTDASDGCDNAESLLQKAEKIGIGLLAITDHDSVGNVEQALRLAPRYGIKLLPGVEISSTALGKDYHILGYNIDCKYPPLLELLQHNTEVLRQKDLDTINNLAKRGWDVSRAEYDAYQAPKGVGGWQALNYLKAKGLCSGVHDFFERIFVKENGLGFPEFVAHTEVIDTIHAAGGKAILAHAGSTFHGLSLTMPLEIFAQVGLDGFECYHPGHNQATTELLTEHCCKRNLLRTAGSDYHGDFAPGRMLGTPQVFAEQLNLKGLL